MPTTKNKPIEARADVPTTSGPTVGAPVERSDITIDVVVGMGDVPCDFWVGLYRTGDRSVADVASAAEVADIFRGAARDGIKVAGPVLITDTLRDRPTFLYLMPPPARGAGTDLHWVQTSMRNIKSWEPEYVGFYMAPELLDIESSAPVLFEMIARYAETHSTRRFCLFVGEHGFHRVLNLALFIKAEMERTQIKVLVRH